MLDSINSGNAYNKFLDLVKYQHGDINKIIISKKTYEVKAKSSGVVSSIDALEVGKLSLDLGAGKVKKEDKIDYGVGIVLNKTVSDKVKKGDVLYTIYYSKKVPDLDNYKIFTIK